MNETEMRYKAALEKIIELHGAFSILRHECTAMANVARNALYGEEDWNWKDEEEVNHD